MKDNLLLLWISWLKDLGGSYEPIRDLSEPKPPTGRRDQDKKPRSYELGTHNPEINQYAITGHGNVVRMEVG